MSTSTTTTTTTTNTTSPFSTTPELAAGVAQFLAPVVIDLEALVVNGKQAHWHVRGRNFIGVHELLDQIVEHAQEYADLAAERIVALGLPVDSRIATVAANTTIPALSEGFQNSDVTITEVIADIDAALAQVRRAVEGLDEVDLNSQDVVIEIERGLTKDRWFLQAHLAA
ncbi:starvation-inducible DNA-binding protein [Curtobacterium sp. PhB130]|uniref:Dps family protein n=1 Tax=unclassified Curtobacterium TaxID=257496 RepID=UPI000F4CE193|nr:MULTISPECIES: DNA starvation/stationary phase protection protein [unclassified Curtobacterium]ROP66122.1 starvation-inducible DNA-binding protein [Curtobacterium sp. ZW137]ROS73830.1 starvation-inducible DNA-binding protein [Curtobacterium sp. PhB130]TCK60221.1 starvation-inducible DNA-binding protein [Curtobacterium sp. PhB136]